MGITILLVDDNATFRGATRSLLEDEPDMTVVAEAGDGETAVELAAEFAPNVVLMDIALPTISGIEATRRLLQADPQCLVVVVSMYSEQRFVERARSVGAVGFVDKATAGDDLVAVVEAVASGGTLLGPGLRGG